MCLTLTVQKTVRLLCEGERGRSEGVAERRKEDREACDQIKWTLFCLLARILDQLSADQGVAPDYTP